MNGGLYHLHKRKRQSLPVCEPFPARTPALRLLDRVMYAVAILSPLALLPQAWQVFINHDGAGLSIWTWVLLGLINGLWMVYGFAHRDKPVYISNILLVLLDFAIVIGILQYS